MYKIRMINLKHRYLLTFIWTCKNKFEFKTKIDIVDSLREYLWVLKIFWIYSKLVRQLYNNIIGIPVLIQYIPIIPNLLFYHRFRLDFLNTKLKFMDISLLLTHRINNGIGAYNAFIINIKYLAFSILCLK